MKKKKFPLKQNEQFKLLDEIIKSSIPLKNDVFMIFASNIDFCQEFLRVILQDEKLVVIDNDIQKNLPSAFNKKVTLDMLCRLGDDSIVNVEIQLTKEKDHAKRIFKYASKIKNYLDENGAKYKDLSDIIEIYLTKEDIFNKGSTIYEVNMNVVSDLKEYVEKWNPGLKVYYVNTEGLTNKTINEYLKLLTDNSTIDGKYKTTSKIKESLYRKGGMNMSLSKDMMLVLDSARAEGIEQGREEGREEGITSTYIKLYKEGLIKAADAARMLEISVAEFTKLMK